MEYSKSGVKKTRTDIINLNKGNELNIFSSRMLQKWERKNNNNPNDYLNLSLEIGKTPHD